MRRLGSFDPSLTPCGSGKDEGGVRTATTDNNALYAIAGLEGITIELEPRSHRVPLKWRYR